MPEAVAQRILDAIAASEAHNPPLRLLIACDRDDVLDQAAARDPDRPCTSFFGRRLSYRALKEASDRFAAALQRLGVAPGDRVGLLLPTAPPFIVAYYGALKAGAVVVALNPLANPHELTSQLRDSGAETLVTIPLFLATVAELRERAGLRRIISAGRRVSAAIGAVDMPSLVPQIGAIRGSFFARQHWLARSIRRPQERLPDLDPAPTIKRILIPLDGSACAEQILPPAIALGALMGSEFTLLHVIASNSAEYGLEWPTTRPGARSSIQLRARAEAYLDRVAELLGAQSLVAHTDVVDGQPTPTILEYACEHSIDLIAIATHGRGGPARLLPGGVADKVVRGASMPVLVYRPPAVADR